MAFKDNRDNIVKKLKVMNVAYEIDDERRWITINGKYGYSYANGYFFTVDGNPDQPLGRGVQDFFDFIKTI